MRKILISLILIYFFFVNGIQPAVAKRIDSQIQNPVGVISCFSGGKEILRKEIVSGPFADEYKFAHEVTVRDETGEHSLNFAGGLCMIDRGEISLPQKLELSDRLTCYSGVSETVAFEVYGRETTVDEYVEGRTFFAKARGIAFNSDSLHEYLIFGSEACIGEETS